MQSTVSLGLPRRSWPFDACLAGAPCFVSLPSQGVGLLFAARPEGAFWPNAEMAGVTSGGKRGGSDRYALSFRVWLKSHQCVISLHGSSQSDKENMRRMSILKPNTQKPWPKRNNKRPLLELLASQNKCAGSLVSSCSVCDMTYAYIRLESDLVSPSFV